MVHLPPKTIFGVERVCKNFLAAIYKTPQIKEKLFLRQRVRTKDTQHTAPELNPFFVAGTGVRSADKHLDARNGISTKGKVRFDIDSSIFNTYLFDVPCGRIKIKATIYAGAERSMTFDLEIVDHGHTVRCLLDSALDMRSDLRVREDEHEVNTWFNYRPAAILNRWQYDDQTLPSKMSDPREWDRQIWLGHFPSIWLRDMVFPNPVDTTEVEDVEDVVEDD